MKKTTTLLFVFCLGFYSAAQEISNTPSKRDSIIAWLRAHQHELDFQFTDSLETYRESHQFEFLDDKIVETTKWLDLKTGERTSSTGIFYYYRPDEIDTYLKWGFKEEDLLEMQGSYGKINFIGIPCEPRLILNEESLFNENLNDTEYGTIYLRFGYPVGDTLAKSKVLKFVEQLQLYLYADWED